MSKHMAGHNKATSSKRSQVPFVELSNTFNRTLDSLAARDASTPALVFHRMVVSTLSSKAKLNGFATFVSKNTEGNRAQESDRHVLELDPKTTHLFRYLCSLTGLPRQRSEAAGDLVTYYATSDPELVRGGELCHQQSS